MSLETRQLWLNATLSEDHTIDRVEARVVGHTAYISTGYGRRELRYGVDVHETFEAARAASLRFVDNKLRRYGEFRERLLKEQEE